MQARRRTLRPPIVALFGLVLAGCNGEVNGADNGEDEIVGPAVLLTAYNETDDTIDGNFGLDYGAGAIAEAFKIAPGASASTVLEPSIVDDAHTYIAEIEHVISFGSSAEPGEFETMVEEDVTQILIDGGVAELSYTFEG